MKEDRKKRERAALLELIEKVKERMYQVTGQLREMVDLEANSQEVVRLTYILGFQLDRLARLAYVPVKNRKQVTVAEVREVLAELGFKEPKCEVKETSQSSKAPERNHARPDFSKKSGNS